MSGGCTTITAGPATDGKTTLNSNPALLTLWAPVPWCWRLRSHLLLGNDAYEGAMAKLAELKRDFTSWEAVSRGADFPKDDVPKAGTHRAA
jgi:hypothetical protein